MLRDQCRIIVQTQWDGRPVDAMIALHARRSAASIAAFRESPLPRPLAVVLTGTDLYGDLPRSPEAAASLDAADQIVVLQEDAPNVLDARWRGRTRVIFQSARALTPARKPRGRLDCVAVGHLREEKDPRTLFEAFRMLPADLPIRLRHIGGALDARLGAEARALQRADSRYLYSGPLSRGLARCAMKAAHLLVHPSVVEGGANVIVESITAGTPLIASRISGNIGMLGSKYPGYFEPGDASGLASRLVQALEEREYLGRLARECAGRRALFTPQAEKRGVRRLVADLLA
jgi:putative glycosyltransferase (TIGR04348 family)